MPYRLKDDFEALPITYAEREGIEWTEELKMKILGELQFDIDEKFREQMITVVQMDEETYRFRMNFKYYPELTLMKVKLDESEEEIKKGLTFMGEDSFLHENGENFVVNMMKKGDIDGIKIILSMMGNKRMVFILRKLSNFVVDSIVNLFSPNSLDNHTIVIKFLHNLSIILYNLSDSASQSAKSKICSWLYFHMHSVQFKILSIFLATIYNCIFCNISLVLTLESLEILDEIRCIQVSKENNDKFCELFEELTKVMDYTKFKEAERLEKERLKEFNTLKLVNGKLKKSVKPRSIGWIMRERFFKLYNKNWSEDDGNIQNGDYELRSENHEEPTNWEEEENEVIFEYHNGFL